MTGSRMYLAKNNIATRPLFIPYSKRRHSWLRAVNGLASGSITPWDAGFVPWAEPGARLQGEGWEGRGEQDFYLWVLQGGQRV